MLSSSQIQKDLLKVEISTYTAQLLLLVHAIIGSHVGIFFLLQRSGLLSRFGSSLPNIIILVSFVAMLSGITASACRAAIVLSFEKKRKKIKEMEERSNLIQDKKYKNFNRRSFRVEAGLAMQNMVQKLLLIGTTCFAFLSTFSTLTMLLFGVGHAKTLSCIGVNLAPIISITGNIAFSASTYMSVASFFMLNNNLDYSKKKDRGKLLRVILLLLCNSLIVVGIAFGHLEMRNFIGPVHLAAEVAVPLSSAFITSGVALYTIFAYGLLSSIEERCESIAKKLKEGRRVDSFLDCSNVLSKTFGGEMSYSVA